MSQYCHLTAFERTCIEILHEKGLSLRSIALSIGRSASTISRELRSGKNHHAIYRAEAAQDSYLKRRKSSKRPRLLSIDTLLRDSIAHFIIDYHWPPEQIASYLKKKTQMKVSFATIYRGIDLDNLGQSKRHGQRGIVRHFHYRGESVIRRESSISVDDLILNIQSMNVLSKQKAELKLAIGKSIP